jgi:hypothetical protein
LANRLDHPRNVYLREAEILPHLDGWLAMVFHPSRIQATVEALSNCGPDTGDTMRTRLRKKIADCDRRLAQYRAALDAGADPAEVTGWINAVKQERARLEGEAQTAPRHAEKATAEEVVQLLTRLGDLARVVVEADTADKARLYRELGLRLTYRPEQDLVQAEVDPEAPMSKRPVSDELRGTVFDGSMIATRLRLREPG